LGGYATDAGCGGALGPSWNDWGTIGTDWGTPRLCVGEDTLDL